MLDQPTANLKWPTTPGFKAAELQARPLFSLRLNLDALRDLSAKFLREGRPWPFWFKCLRLRDRIEAELRRRANEPARPN